MSKAIGSPFAINWLDLEAVKAYARKLGKGIAVIKYSDRPNFNIAFKNRAKNNPDCVILFETTE